MKKDKYKFKQRATRVAHFIDLPPEAVAGSVTLHITENSYCTVENFRSLPELTSERVRLSCNGFELCIEGENLIAQELSEGLLVLKGRIDGVSYKQGGK